MLSLVHFIFPDSMRCSGAVRSLGADYVERLGALVAAMYDVLPLVRRGWWFTLSTCRGR
jgi:hypothetical protein